MKADEIAEKLRLHGLWQDGHPDGVRADFTNARLEGADFADARLERATFTGARLDGAKFTDAVLDRVNFTGAKLYDADFTRAVLNSADFTRARLKPANFTGAWLDGAAGLVCLPVHDPRGYRPVAVRHGDDWMIAVGCRWYTPAEALAHWGSPGYPDRARGEQYAAAVKWLVENGGERK